MHKFLVCAYNSRDFAQTSEKFAWSNEHLDTLTVLYSTVLYCPIDGLQRQSKQCNRLSLRMSPGGAGGGRIIQGRNLKGCCNMLKLPLVLAQKYQ